MPSPEHERQLPLYGYEQKPLFLEGHMYQWIDGAITEVVNINGSLRPLRTSLERTDVAQADYDRTVCDVAGRELTPNIARERALAIGQSILGELTFNYDDDNKADILRDRLNELVDQNAFTADEAHAIMLAWYELKGLR